MLHANKAEWAILTEEGRRLQDFRTADDNVRPFYAHQSAPQWRFKTDPRDPVPFLFTTDYGRVFASQSVHGLFDFKPTQPASSQQYPLFTAYDVGVCLRSLSFRFDFVQTSVHVAADELLFVAVATRLNALSKAGYRNPGYTFMSFVQSVVLLQRGQERWQASYDSLKGVPWSLTVFGSLTERLSDYMGPVPPTAPFGLSPLAFAVYVPLPLNLVPHAQEDAEPNPVVNAS